MALVITEPCMGAKGTCGTPCVEVCPVSCIHPTQDEDGFETARMLFIHPVECIDCFACVPVCPVEAIFTTDEVPDQWKSYIEKNAQHYK